MRVTDFPTSNNSSFHLTSQRNIKQTLETEDSAYPNHRKYCWASVRSPASSWDNAAGCSCLADNRHRRILER